jgi:hypothetical protein
MLKINEPTNNTVHLFKRKLNRRPRRQMRKITSTKRATIATTLVALVALAFVPIFPGKATYDGIGAAKGLNIVRKDVGTPFVIEGGKLYLLRQKTWHALVLVTRVKHFSFDLPGSDLDNLKKEFPELRDNELWR